MHHRTDVTPMTVEDLRARWSAAWPFLAVGVPCIVVGGLVSAITRPTGFAAGPWVTAYLVLVAGVAQVGLGAGQALLSAQPPAGRTTAWELLAWNVGNGAVLAGTLAGTPSAVAAGGIALFAALALFLHGVGRPRHGSRGWLAGYRLLTGAIAVSIPVGVVLSVLRHG